MPSNSTHNQNENVIKDFGQEWEEYNQRDLDRQELLDLFEKYFSIFPFEMVSKKSVGFDMGCGSGRWASVFADRVGSLWCIEPSNRALGIARKNLQKYKNCKFENGDVLNNSLTKDSQDFGYCLGVLHHISDTKSGLKACVDKLKKGAPFLLYLYYNFDNKPYWFKLLWKVSDFFRRLISKMPFNLKLFITKLIALFIYFPLARVSYYFEKLGFDVNNFPISSYRRSSFYTMKTDALDRFGTKLENRFTKNEILTMMEDCGLTNVKFSDKVPFWVAVGIKA